MIHGMIVFWEKYAFKTQKTEKDNETVKMVTEEKWKVELERR